MAVIKLAQIQLRPSADGEASLARAAEACAEAAARGASLLALPEMFCCPYDAALFPRYAQPEGGPVWRACSELAARLGVYLSAGSVPERGADGGVYNTAYVFDRAGRPLAKHRKIHLFDVDIRGGQRFRESDTLSAGDRATVFDTEFGRLGLCVCFDFRFPELGREMALAGARAVLAPAAFNQTTGPLHWELTFRAQAVFNQCFTVGTASALDPDAAYHSWGHSIAVDPWGRVLRQMGAEEGIQYSELDLSMADDVREQLPLLRSFEKN